MEVNSIINECAQKTRSYIVQYSEKIEKYNSLNLD